MRTLALHLACLRELEARERPLSRSALVGFIALGSVVALGLAGCHLLERLVVERLGVP